LAQKFGWDNKGLKFQVSSFKFEHSELTWSAGRQDHSQAIKHETSNLKLETYSGVDMSEQDVIKGTRPRMDTVIDDFQRKLATVRTGRAAVSLLDSVMVDYYGTMTPLNQMASVHAPEPAMLTVQPWDQTQVPTIEKAIRAADLGLNPSNDGKLVRIPIPALTEERRKQLVKQVHEIAEDHRTAVRNIRRDSNERLKKMLKDKEISEDNERDGLDEVQKLTNTYIGKIDELTKSKETELTNV
jgi:ribosome recycling factor